MNTIRHLLIADGDPSVVHVMRHYLESLQFRLLVAYDGRAALETIYRYLPHLLILDPALPDLDGWEMIRQMRRDSMLAQLPIIVLTACNRDIDRILWLELGADDFVCKPFIPRELAARTQAVLRRAHSGADAAQVFEYGGIHMDISQHQVTLNGRPVALTPTEFDLLYVLMISPGRTFTRSALIEQSRPLDSDSLERTIDSHIKNLRRKLELPSRTANYIQTVYGVGYRLEVEPYTH